MGQLGDLSPQGSVAVGIVVGLLSTSIQSLGLTLQRKSHLLEDEKDVPETRRPPYRRRRWQLGMFMFVFSNLVGSTIQITTLPLPVLSTLQASGLVFNTAFATILLKEPFTRFSMIGTILTCGGAALIAIFGAIGEPAHSLTQLLNLLGRRQFIIWMAGTLTLAAGTILFAHVLKLYSSQKRFEQYLQKVERSLSFSLPNPNLSNLRRSFTTSLPQPQQLRLSRMRLARGLCYALISGILSAHSLLVAKSAVELIVRTIVDHNNQFKNFQSWLILVALIFFALTQLYYLHLGLRLCSTSVLYPFVFCVYNIIAILDGLIYFHQADRLSAVHGGLIAVGTVILLSGVLALSWRLDDTTPSNPVTPQILPPPTPLTPGMGFVRSSEDLERSPLLPITRPRSSTTGSRRSVNEQTPLLYHRQSRVPALAINPPPPETDATEIWAELDDESAADEDFLASLPRTPSPYLTSHPTRPRRRSRGDSISSFGLVSDTSKLNRGSSGSEVPRREQAAQERANGERRRSSAPGLSRVGGSESKPGTQSPAEKSTQSLHQKGHAEGEREANGRAVQEGAEDARSRTRSYSSAATRFPKSQQQPQPVVPSRWDLQVSKSLKGKGKEVDDPEVDPRTKPGTDPGG